MPLLPVNTYAETMAAPCVCMCSRSTHTLLHPTLPLYVSGAGQTLFSLLVSLFHGHKGREVRLVIGQNQGRTVAPVGRHLQGQVDPSKWDGRKCCGHRHGESWRARVGKGGVG